MHVSLLHILFPIKIWSFPTLVFLNLNHFSQWSTPLPEQIPNKSPMEYKIDLPNGLPMKTQSNSMMIYLSIKYV